MSERRSVSGMPRSTALGELTPGLVVDDKYRIEEPLGRGAMGVVFAARQLDLDERVALKFLLLDDDAHQFRSRFAREARVCAKLRNDHVVRVVDFGTFRESVAYMVMECLEGRDLRTLLREQGGRLSAEIAVDYAVQACEGLADVHAKGIVHRDLKPSNLFVTRRDDGSDLLKILDFGISKSFDPGNVDLGTELTETGMLLGTPRFMSPEQLFGAKHVDARADVWSLAAIVYEMLTGRPPFEADSFANLCARLSLGDPPPAPSALRSGLPRALDRAVLAALECDVDGRTPNVAELAGDLLEAIGSERAGEVRARLGAVVAAITAIARAPMHVAAERTPRRGSSTVLLALAGSAVFAVAALTLLHRTSEAPSLARAVEIEAPASSIAVAPPASAPTASAPPVASAVAPLATHANVVPPKIVALTTKTVESSAPPAPAPAPSPSASASQKSKLDVLLEDRN